MARKRRKIPRRGEQLSFRPRGRGGARPGAGRPLKPGAGVPHLRRTSLSIHHPVHVTLRVLRGVPNLRRRALMKVIERALRAARDRFGMRVVHYSVQANHLHLIAEADDARALTRGLQGLCIRIAKRLNQHLTRRGKLFADRYHARALKTPTEVRHALRYVLQNAHKHALERGEFLPSGAIDLCSSARYFDGYADRDRNLVLEGWSRDPPPISSATCWLLTTGWRRRGLLRTTDLPGLPRPPRARKR
jgi:REP-associated tyrosine transposase